MPDPKFKAIEDLVGLVAELANAVVAAPKPLTVASLSGLLPLLPQIEVLALEAGEIPGELSEVDEAEAEALVAKVAGVLVLKDPHAEAVVDASLKLVVAALGLLEAIKSK